MGVCPGSYKVENCREEDLREWGEIREGRRGRRGIGEGREGDREVMDERVVWEGR